MDESHKPCHYKLSELDLKDNLNLDVSRCFVTKRGEQGLRERVHVLSKWNREKIKRGFERTNLQDNFV